MHQVQLKEEEGHFVFSHGLILDRGAAFPQGRYVCRKMLGSGVYGKVVEVDDNKHRAKAAIKV